jgi:uncharacterized membrane protein
MDLNFKSNSKYLAEVAIIAAIYTILTVMLSWISYGQIQFRVAEALLVLVLYKKSGPAGLVLGCLIANIFSPFGLPDIIFGTLGSVFAVSGIYLLRKQNIFVSLLPGVIANAILVGLELKIFVNLPFFLTAMYVAAGQAIVIYALGIPLYYALKKIGFKNDYENVLIN